MRPRRRFTRFLLGAVNCRSSYTCVYSNCGTHASRSQDTSFSQPQSSRPGKAPFPSHPPSFPSTPTRPHHPLEIRWLAVNARSTPASQNTRTESQRPSAPRKFCASPAALPDPHRLTHTSPSLSIPPLPPPLILLPRFCSPARRLPSLSPPPTTHHLPLSQANLQSASPPPLET